MSASLRAAALPLVAAALVAGVLGVQRAHGGGDFVPVRSADPCAARVVRSVSSGIQGLTERLVLLGIDGAACRLGVTREALILTLAGGGSVTTAEVNAVRAGLLGAVTRMKADGSLPPAADLANEAVDLSSLPGFVKSIVKALPDSVVNGALKTDDVLRRTIADLDLRKVLTDLRNPDALTAQINAAVQKAVVDALVARLTSLI